MSTNPAPHDAPFRDAYAELAKGAAVAQDATPPRPTVIRAPGAALPRATGLWRPGELPVDAVGLGTVLAALLAFFGAVWCSGNGFAGKLLLSGLLLFGVGATLLALAWWVRAP